MPPLKPRWFYGIPQVSGGGDNKIGFTGAICATAGAPINAKDCDLKDFFSSYLAVMKVSRFPASYDDKVIKDKDIYHYQYSRNFPISWICRLFRPGYRRRRRRRDNKSGTRRCFFNTEQYARQ